VPDLHQGERRKLWGVILIALLVLAFILIRHALEKAP
jgi:hypothetical protein